MQNDVFEKRPAEEHDQPVAIKRDVLARRGHIIKSVHTITKPAPDGLQAKQEEPHEFDALDFADVFEPLGKLGIDVKTFDAEGRWLLRPVRFLPPVAAKAAEHELDHVALAVMRRRHMGEDKQFHFGFAIYDIRFARRANLEIVNRKS